MRVTAQPRTEVLNPHGSPVCGRDTQAVCAGIVRGGLPKDAGHHRKAGSEMSEFLWLLSVGVGCSRSLAWAHNPKVAGSNPAPATKNDLSSARGGQATASPLVSRYSAPTPNAVGGWTGMEAVG